MALVKFGAGVIQMSGSIAGNVYARNRSGNYVRARTKPVNPNSSGQVVIRAALATLTTRWAQTLTALQRTAWNLYASNVAMTNKLGETIHLTGFNHYLRSNIPRLQIGTGIIDAGPVVFELPAQDPTMFLEASEASQKISVSFDNTMDWATETDAVMYLYQGQPQNAQRNFFAGPWKLLGYIAGDVGGAPATPQLKDVVFATAELQRLWVYARIQRVDGRLSEKFRADTFCLA